MSSSPRSSSRWSSSRTSSVMPALISRRTARPNWRRRSSISTAARRSSASSSSRVRSALRLTRKVAVDSTSIPGKSWPRWAAITCSSGTNRSPSGMTTNRGSRSGTFTRANRRSPVTGSRRSTARFSERFEMYGNGWPGSTASGVSTGKIRCSNVSTRNFSSSSSRSSQRERRDAAGGQRRDDLVEEQRAAAARRAPRPARAPRGAAGAGVRPSGEATPSPAATCSLRPATRTWKNSSRFWLKMARNLARSRSGHGVVGRQGEHPLVEVEPGQLAVEVARGVGRSSSRPSTGSHAPQPSAGSYRSTAGPAMAGR